MTLKAIVATKIVEYKKRGINQYVRSLKRLDCLVVRQKGHDIIHVAVLEEL